MNILMVGYVVAGIMGLVMGSYAGASVWRLRARQLKEDKAAGEEFDAKELKQLLPLTKANIKNDRSQCLHCGHTLSWYDLIPLVSWLSTRGRCRYCNHQIGHFEPLIEIVTALLFIGFYYYWTVSYPTSAWAVLIVGAISIVLMMILFAYDAKWFLLPDRIMFILIGIAACDAAWSILASDEPLTALWSTIGALVILSGLYLLLWLYSRGAWVGFGDVKLGLALGLFLGDWQLAFLTLFLANLIGVVVILPGLISKKLSRKTQIPFGPFLIAGFFVALFFGHTVIDWYLSLTSMLML